MRDSDFDAFYATRAPRLRRVAYLVVRDWVEAEDIVQAAFVKIYMHWRRLRPATLDPYVRRAVVNQAISRTREARREIVVTEIPDSEARPDHSALVVMQALADVSPVQRAVIALRVLDDLSVSQVADLLKMPEGTVKSHSARGLAVVRDAVATEEREKR